MAELHPGDLLSALVDGELDVRDAEAVRVHVAGCAACRLELEEVRAARRAVRLLPAVEPPPAFLAELVAAPDVVALAPRRRRAAVLVNAAGSVAAGLAILALSAADVGPPPVDPEVPMAVARHASTVSALEAGGVIAPAAERFAPEALAPPTTAERHALEDLRAPYAAPPMIAGYRLVEAYRSGAGVHLLYRRGAYGLSIFELEGSIDWTALPADGSEIEIGRQRAWRWDDPRAGGRLVVVERPGMVVLLVGDEPGDAVLEVARALPGPREPAFTTRVKQSVGRALDLLAP
ncbi:MAG TPA: zf-HC2 domain-containing protein [Acidimicrobiales bacterium]|nr:zf-HC2 domain-containing protein [Acidimicrobiales bacterium]